MRLFASLLVVALVVAVLLAMEPRSQTSLIDPLPSSTPNALNMDRAAPGWRFVNPIPDDYATVRALMATVGPPK